jgi:hypothetical protein
MVTSMAAMRDLRWSRSKIPPDVLPSIPEGAEAGLQVFDHVGVV